MKKTVFESLVYLVLLSSIQASSNVGDDLDSIDKKGFAYLGNGKLDTVKIVMLSILGV